LYRLADSYPRWRIPVLLALSLAFYSYWDIRFLALLLPSVLLNWLAARQYHRSKHAGIVVAAIVGNLGTLAFFKYGDFLGENVAALLAIDYTPMHLALPLGISFLTFHHIMYLVDLRRGLAPCYTLDRYCLYIAFFPQVISGPIVRWSEVMEQFGNRAFAPGWEQRFALGITLIVLGLAQKVFLGDPLGTIVNDAYTAMERAPLYDGSAWQAVIGFTFQIFFDFSAYSDVAIGTALLFGIALPINFDAPLRALDLQSFWRRWHMTLSRFLRDYLYIAMGGNRLGLSRQVAAILVTMALGGLWHGARWTFVAWGLLHGAAIALCAAWHRLGRPLPAPIAWALTFSFVALTFVFFRASTFTGAMQVFESLAASPFGPTGWRTIGAAAICALALPASHRIAARLTEVPRRSVAVALALGAIAVVIQLGHFENHEFIYFQF
jgi:D-alanyl-lipoteichoic acid acyltransferase DltB (MBOAT superfamily)